MPTTLKLTAASLKMFLRNRQALFFSLFTPIIVILIFGYIGFDKPQKIDVGLVVEDPTPQTAQFVESLKNFPTFTIHEGNLADEYDQLNEGNRAAVLTIPGNFMSVNPNPSGQEPKHLGAYINAGQQGQGQAVVSIVNQMLDRTTSALYRVPTLFVIDQQVMNAHNLRYIEFLLPGLIALSVMQMSVFSVAFVFTQYKEKGVLKRLLATPMRPHQFVSANVITRLLVAVLQTAIFIGLGILLFNVHIIGSYLLLLFCVILGAIMFLGLGFTISGLSKTVDSVPAIANLVVFPMLFLGGTFFAISNMPPWLQHVARFLPLTFFSTALRDIMTKGASFSDIKWSILGMLVWGVALIALSTLTFSFQERESA